MIAWNGRRYLFKFRRGFFLLCLGLWVLCIMLGIWQFHRYHFKQILLFNYHSRMQSKPQGLQALLNTTMDLQFQPVRIEGTYLNELTLLVQNRFYHGQWGFEVLTPVKLPQEQKLLLVDRGWAAKPFDQTLPEVSAPPGRAYLTGHIKLLNEYQFILGKNLLYPHKKPWVLQKVDFIELAQLTHYTFFPFIVRLGAGQPGALPHEWGPPTAVSPERHLGYAIQWFVMAVVLCIAFCCFCMERVEKNNE